MNNQPPKRQKEFKSDKREKRRTCARAVCICVRTGKHDARHTAPQKVLQEITNDINDHIAPFNKILLPFYITATEYISQSLRAHFPKEAEIADDLKSNLTCYGIIFPRRKNK